MRVLSGPGDGDALLGQDSQCVQSSHSRGSVIRQPDYSAINNLGQMPQYCNVLAGLTYINIIHIFENYVRLEYTKK